MIDTIREFTADLSRGVQVQHLREIYATKDALAHTIRVAVVRGSEAVGLEDATISGTFVRADGVTVALEGEAEDNRASVALIAPCYAVPGRFVLSIRVTAGGVVSTVFVGDGAVMQTSTDSIVTTEDVALSLEELFARLTAAEAAVSASAEKAAEAEESATAAAELAQGAAEATAAANAAADRANAVADRLEGVDVGSLAGEIDAVRDAIKATSLWSGTWEGGSINVPNIGDWKLLQILMPIGYVLAVNGGTVQGIGLSATATMHRTLGVRFAVSGTTCTLTTAHYIDHNSSGSHGALTKSSITGIVGLIKGV